MKNYRRRILLSLEIKQKTGNKKKRESTALGKWFIDINVLERDIKVFYFAISIKKLSLSIIY